jgi:hypothetical protein
MEIYRLCSVGRFLQWAIEATGGLTKQNDPKGQLRKTADRLAHEHQVDPSSFERILDHIAHRADRFISNDAGHWLSGAMWRDALNAYQYLTVKLNTLGRNPGIAGQMLFAEVLSWFARSLLHWYTEGQNVPQPYEESFLWFISSDEDGKRIAFRRAIEKLRSEFFNSDYEFSKFVVAVEHREIHEDSVRDQSKQLKDWENGVHFPDTRRFEDLCQSIEKAPKKIAAQFNIHPNRIKRIVKELLESYYLSTFFGSLESLATYFGVDAAQVQYPHEWFLFLIDRDGQLAQNGSEWVLRAIPSSSRMDAPYRAEYVQDIIQAPLDNEGHIAFGDFHDREDFESMSTILPSASDKDTLNLLCDITDIADRAAYCNCPLFADTIRCVAEWCNRLKSSPVKNRLQKRIHQQMHLHGMLRESAQESEKWLRAKTAAAERGEILPKDYYLRDDSEVAPIFERILEERSVSEFDKAKIRKFRRDRVDEWIKDRPYRRTRLMMAVGLKMYDTATRLIAAGADPCLASTSFGKKSGDNGTAFLFAVQSYKYEYLHGNAAGAAELWQVMKHMERQSHDLGQCLDTPTFIRNYTCLGEAVSSTDPNLVKWLIELGASVEYLTGGDELTPLYLALNELHLRAARREMGNALFLRHAADRADFNMQRMNPIVSAMIADEELFRKFQKDILDDPRMAKLDAKALNTSIPLSPGDEDRLLAIMEVLLKNGANPNAIQKNGFTPLGFCVEISEVAVVGDKAAELLHAFGGTKVLP